jgi:hypothetical protein
MSTLTSTTSTTRPTLGASDVGKSYFETDSNKILVWDGSAWNEWNKDLIVDPNFNNLKSVQLDGSNDHVLLPSNSSYGFGTGDFSIICWFNADTVSTFSALYDFRTSTSSTHPSFFIGLNNNLKYYFNTGNSQINYNTTPSTSTWFMSSVVRSSGTTTVYQNQNQVANGSNTHSYGTPTNGIRIGVNAANSTAFDGYVDEFAVWDKALTATQISDIYNGGNPTNLDDLGLSNQPLTWLRMGDNDSGTTVTDHGSLSNDASLQNGAAFSSTVP